MIRLCENEDAEVYEFTGDSLASLFHELGRWVVEEKPTVVHSVTTNYDEDDQPYLTVIIKR